MVLEVTLQAIAERGVGAVSTRDIARQAGVSEALIFHHFGTKAGLLEAAAQSGGTLLAKVMAMADGPPPEDLGGAVDALMQEAALRLRPGGAAWAMVSSLVSRDAAVAGLRAEGLTLLARARSALAAWMDAAPTPPRHGGTSAVETLFDGLLWRVATLPDDPEAWDAAAPAAFASLAARWRALHLED
jgi:AcrR family transcriptional regulator